MTISVERILIFEWFCGGGLWIDNVEPAATKNLFQQGRQMLLDLCCDFREAGFDPVVTLDSRFSTDVPGRKISVREGDDLPALLAELTKTCDLALVIAPETGGRLVNCLHWLAEHQEKILNANLQFTDLATDKNRTQCHLAKNGVPVPVGGNAADWFAQPKLENLNAKYVLKPRDGCGGEGLEIFENLDQMNNANPREWKDWRIEQYVPGTAVSVAAICGDYDRLILPPLRQEFDEPPIGKFSRCVHDLPTAISARARQLANMTIDSLPPAGGFFGIDCVIGKRDVVIEINPRITTSYGCLRKHVDFSLAKKMVGILCGSG